MTDDKQRGAGGNRHIVQESPYEIKLLSAQHMRAKIAPYMLGIMIFYALSEWIPNVLGVLIPRSYESVIPLPVDEELLEQLPSMAISALLYVFLLSGALLFGRSVYLLKFLRNQCCDYLSLLDGLGLFFKATGLYLLQSLIVACGLLLFLLPGVIAYYSFRQSFYILADDPSKGILRCLSESRERMAGNKLRLFSVDMSYFLLILVAYIPSAYVEGSGMVDLTTLSGTIADALLRFPAYYAFGCLYLCQAVFYESLTHRGFARFPYRGEALFREAASSKEEDTRR